MYKQRWRYHDNKQLNSIITTIETVVMVMSNPGLRFVEAVEKEKENV